MELRPYQQQIVAIVVDSKGNVLVNASTGAGKTICFSKALQMFAEKGLKSLVLAHRGQLIDQAADKLMKATGLGCAVFCAGLGKKEIGGITIASVQSLANWSGDLGFFDIVIVDECHRLPPKSVESQYKKVLERVDGRLIGFTATPYRLGSGPIYGKEDSWFSELNYRIGLRELIADGYLCEFLHKMSVATATIQKSMKTVKTGADGDYKEKETTEVMTKVMNINSVINSVPTEVKKVVVFCVSIEHAEAIGEAMTRRGIEFGIVHSQMKKRDREMNLDNFDNGDLRWMLNVNVLTEGWDSTAVDCIVLARPTKSSALYVQMCGRGLRLHPGKDRCLILDIVGLYDELGPIYNPLVDFEDDFKIETDKEPEGKVCEQCFAVVPGNTKVCPECGHEFVEDKPVLIEDDEDKMHVLVDTEVADLGTVYGGKCVDYLSKAGNYCLKVSYFHSQKRYPINHFYSLDPKNYWVKSDLAKIVRRGYPDFKEKTIDPDRFKAAVNGGYIFPMKDLQVVKNEKGFEKIAGL